MLYVPWSLGVYQYNNKTCASQCLPLALPQADISGYITNTHLETMAYILHLSPHTHNTEAVLCTYVHVIPPIVSVVENIM